VRELANAMERASILSNTDAILPEHLPASVRNCVSEAAALSEGASEVKTVMEAEAEAIRSALARTGGNRTKAAEILGISRRALIYKIKRFGLS